MSFLNGLSAAGAAVSQFAGAAGLESQKADLARQNLTLADQLTGTREAATAAQLATTQAAAAQKEQDFRAGQTTITEAGATARNAATNTTSLAVAKTQAGVDYAKLAQALPEQQALIAQQRQETAQATIKTENAQQLQSAQNALAAEQAKDNPDPDKLTSLKSNILAIGYSSTNDMEVQKAKAQIYSIDKQAVDNAQRQVDSLTIDMNKPDMQDTDRAKAQAALDNAKQILAGANAALQFSRGATHPGMAALTPPGNRPPLSSFGGGPPANASASPRAVPSPATAPPPAGGFMNNGTGMSP